MALGACAGFDRERIYLYPVQNISIGRVGVFNGYAKNRRRAGSPYRLPATYQPTHNVGNQVSRLATTVPLQARFASGAGGWRR